MTMSDKVMDKLKSDEHILIKKADRNEIDEETFAKKHSGLKEKIKDRLNFLLEGHKQRVEKLKEEGGKKMEEAEQTQAVETPKAGRKPREGSYATVIAQVLGMAAVKTVDEAVAKIDELKPGREKAKNVSQTKTIIREAKAGKGRWKDFTWDEENFQLTSKA